MGTVSVVAGGMLVRAFQFVELAELAGGAEEVVVGCGDVVHEFQSAELAE